MWGTFILLSSTISASIIRAACDDIDKFIPLPRWSRQWIENTLNSLTEKLDLIRALKT